MKTCPKCRSQHFDGVDLCDCGYSFATGQVNAAQHSSGRSKSTSPRGWLIAGGTFVLMMIAGSFMGKMVGTQAASTVNRLESARPPAPPAKAPDSEIQTFVVRQDATGYSNGDLDPLVLRRIESMLVAGAVEKARAHVRSEGYEPTDITRDMYKSNSRLTEMSGQKFGVVDISAQGINIKTVLTIRGNEFVRVNCIRKSNEAIPLTSGPCAAQVESTFGVKFPRIN